MNKKSLLRRAIDQRYLLVLLLPGLLYFVIFKYVPMYGIIIAFKDYDFMRGIQNSAWVGFKYFKELTIFSFSL